MLDRFTDQNWDQAVLASAGPVAVMFWAEWNIPSRTGVEMAQKLSAERTGRLRLGVLDVDGNPRATERYGIQGLPTLIVFQGGHPVERRVGLMSREDLGRLLERHA